MTTLEFLVPRSWYTKGNREQQKQLLHSFRPMGKFAWNGPKWGWELFFSTNPDLADILGDTDFDFENLIFFRFLDPRFLDFQIAGFPDSRLSSSYVCPGWYE